MRAAIPDLSTAHPIGGMLPSVLQEDVTAMRLTAALDEVIAPVISTLDCLRAYVDTDLAPPDFLEWLAGWVGATLDENWAAERRRATVATAVEQHRTRGTVAGLRSYLEAVTGTPVEVLDSGGVATSSAPDCAYPGEEVPSIVVRIGKRCPVRAADVDRLVAEAKPAHVAHRVEQV